ncbi:uncharacterized protein mylk4b [Aplochiton taeniatus]
MSSSLVNSLAKVYDPNPLHGQKPGRRMSPTGADKAPSSSPSSPTPDTSALHGVESRMDSLSSQMERLLSMQETVLTRLDGMSQDLGGVGREVASLQARRSGAAGGTAGDPAREMRSVCRELQGVVEEFGKRVESQGHRLEGVEKLVEGMQQVISFIGEAVKSSRLVELLFREPGRRAGKASRKVSVVRQTRWNAPFPLLSKQLCPSTERRCHCIMFPLKDDNLKDGKGKLSQKGLKAQRTRKPPDAADSSLTEPLLPDPVETFNRQNAERSHCGAESEGRRKGGGGAAELELILDGQRAPMAQAEEDAEEREEGESEDESRGAELRMTKGSEQSGEEGEVEAATDLLSLLPQESSEEAGEMAASSKRRVLEEDLVKDDLKKSRVEETEEGQEGAETHAGQSEAAKTGEEEEGQEKQPTTEEFVIDSSPPPSAPFDHRIVTPKPHQIATYYSINREELLGGGRFGQVHKCVENSSGLTLAAKIIKARSQKEKDVVKNEIQVMNQLNHSNLIQLYAAFESRHDVILVMEYVDGGELFDRIIDENYNLTELDTVLFIRQICEGLQYMHKMYILHLDLKPENILCVSRATNKIKIIDFGLARRYKPREKLRVNFGTPEFLAPEVINYEFVSFPTDMWSLGVITYMLLSGLSPFLGDDDNETLNNILACQWNFEEEEFADISEEAKDFITRLLVKSKSWRMSAAESLRHPWLSDHSLHCRLHQKKNKCHSTHAPSPES